MRFPAVVLVVLLACLAGTHAKRKLPKIPKFIVNRNIGDVEMGPSGPKFQDRGQGAVNRMKELLGADDDEAVAAFRNEALKHFNEQFDFGLESTEINAPLVGPYVLQACPETANPTCLPAILTAYKPVDTVSVQIVARNDKRLRDPQGSVDCGFELFSGTEGFKGLAPDTYIFYGIFAARSGEGNSRFFYRSLEVFEPPYYELDVFKTDYGKTGTLTGAFRFTPKEEGTVLYEDWVIIEMDV